MIRKLPGWIWIGAWLLAFVGGIVNVVGFLSFEHRAITHLTGTTSMLGVAIAESDIPSAFRMAASIGSFLMGCAISGFLIQNSTLQLNRRYWAALLLESLLLCLAVPCFERMSRWGIYLAACACGLQNAMISTYTGMVVRTTHVSGMFTDLGISLGHALRGVPADALRVRLCVIVISAFLCGGIAGGWMFHHIGYRTLLIPSGMTFLIALIFGVLQTRKSHRLEG